MQLVNIQNLVRPTQVKVQIYTIFIGKRLLFFFPNLNTRIINLPMISLQLLFETFKQTMRLPTNNSEVQSKRSQAKYFKLVLHTRKGTLNIYYDREKRTLWTLWSLHCQASVPSDSIKQRHRFRKYQMNYNEVKLSIQNKFEETCTMLQYADVFSRYKGLYFLNSEVFQPLL